MRRLLPLLALVPLCAASLAGQQPSHSAAGATVRGIVTDSLAGAPLAGATVQLVSTDPAAPLSRAVASDAAGRFSFGDVPEGRYLLGFVHPVLEELGLEPMARAVTVARRREVRVDLAVPGPVRLKAAFCGGRAEGGAVFGIVRSASGQAPVERATVLAEWLELTLASGGVAQRSARRATTTAANGGFVLCDVPSPGSVRLLALLETDSTDRFEVQVPPSGLLRRDLYLGEARIAARLDSAVADDSLVPPPPRIGPGRLSGTAMSAEGGRPLAGALVGVVGGEPVRADPSGHWTLTGVPSGTRLLEVRAPGHEPVVRVVDITDVAPPLRVALSRAVPMLDTLRVVAVARSRLARSGFQERRQGWGTGRFLTAADIEKRRLWDTSDLFMYVPGMAREPSPEGGFKITMRSAFGEGCTPALFLDGNLIADLDAVDVDLLVRPREIAAVEVYRESQVPPQFQVGQSGCGSVVIWTK